MKTNTVILSLYDYDELGRQLRECFRFKENIEKNNTLFVTSKYDGGFEMWVSSDEAVKKLADFNDKLLLKIKELSLGEKKEPTISEIKKMSVWQFLKWRNA